jgi:hypothetical protein
MLRLKSFLLGLILAAVPLVCSAAIITLDIRSVFANEIVSLPSGVVGSSGLISSATQTASFGDATGSIFINPIPSEFGFSMELVAQTGSNLAPGLSIGAASFTHYFDVVNTNNFAVDLVGQSIYLTTNIVGYPYGFPGSFDPASEFSRLEWIWQATSSNGSLSGNECWVLFAGDRFNRCGGVSGNSYQDDYSQWYSSPFTLAPNESERFLATVSLNYVVGRVPEPNTLALLALGLVGLATTRRRGGLRY